jgi:type I restriction enzyme S subunit
MSANSGQDHIAPECFPIPSLKEQNEIIIYLDNETTKLDTLTAEAQSAITLLQERRTALISAAVTGKIDVRGLVSDYA